MKRTFHIKGAVVLAALYALCILAPSAAFAFVAPDLAAHCLTEDHGFAASLHHAAKAHVHVDGVTHHHSESHASQQPTDGGSKGHAESCCGLFSLVAIAGGPALSLGVFSVASLPFPALHDAMSGRSPERINRPPIA